MRRGNALLISIIVVAVVIVGVVVFTQKTSKTSKQTSQQIETQTETNYQVFNQADYEKAKNEGKVIFLNFYANWCPICRAEEPDLKAGFDNLKTDKIAGFRVNYNDSDTDSAEKALAKEFGITYQHTKVVLKKGEKVLGPLIEQWDSETLVKELNKFL